MRVKLNAPKKQQRMKTMVISLKAFLTSLGKRAETNVTNLPGQIQRI